jgi:pimeloyl-ACP methyl ester carboxylesterase
MAQVQVGEIEIYYELHGDGEPLLLILGLGADISQYHGIIDRLAMKHRVIAFDNRGVGRTSKPDLPYSMDIMADDAVGLLHALGLKCVNVVGISMGGRVALSMAIRHPTSIDRLVLVCTGPRRVPKIDVSVGMRLLFPFRWLPIFRSSFPQPRFAYERQYQATIDFDVRDELSNIHLDTLIAHGRKDRTAPYSGALEMHRKIDGSELATFSGGHAFFLLRERYRFLKVINRFLSQKTQVLPPE